MCGHYLKKNSPCFIIVWCGTFRSDFSHAQNKYGGSLDLKLLHIPGMSAGLITAIPFKSVSWHPAHKKLRD